jgi:hypothetical protein
VIPLALIGVLNGPLQQDFGDRPEGASEAALWQRSLQNQKAGSDQQLNDEKTVLICSSVRQALIENHERLTALAEGDQD